MNIGGLIDTTGQTGSTNADLAARLQSGRRIAEGYWLVADRQTAGRGRQGREWFDGHGNFMGSTIVHVGPRDPAPATLALVAGLAAYEAVLRHCPGQTGFKLKWPNDLMYSSAKLGGILLEREGDAVIIGIGVNLKIAPDLPDRKTAALSKFGPPPDRDAFARTLASSLDQELERWRTYGIEPLLRRWESAAHPRGTALTVHEQSDGTISGTFDGLESDGCLRMRLADGSTRVIHAGDVMLA